MDNSCRPNCLFSYWSGDAVKRNILKYFSFFFFFLYSSIFCFIACNHILYPGFTETMEGDVLQHIQRISNGESPYKAIDGKFIPLCYMPLYYVFALPFYLVFGDSFIGPRLISCIFAIGSGILIGWIGWRETKSHIVAALASAFFFSGYRIMDAYLTCALPDSMFLFCLLMGYRFFAYSRNRLHDILWILCFSLAFWTKQHGAFFFGGVVFYALLFRKNYLPKLMIVMGLILGGPISYIVFLKLFGGDFLFYTFTVPGGWEHSIWISLRRTIFVLACFIPFLSLLSLFFLNKTIQIKKMKFTPLSWFLLTAFLSTMITMTAAGSSNNHYIPFIAILGITAACGFNELLNFNNIFKYWWLFFSICFFSIGVVLVSLKLYDNHYIPIFVPIIAVLFLISYFIVSQIRLSLNKKQLLISIFLVLSQFAVSFYDPRSYLPDVEYQKDMLLLQKELNKLEAPVIWLPYGNVPQKLTGKKIESGPSWVVLEDLERQDNRNDHAEKILHRFKDHFDSKNELYILADGHLENFPGWSMLSNDFTLIQDFGTKFSGLRMAADHWFGGKNYPKFLYRKGIR